MCFFHLQAYSILIASLFHRTALIFIVAYMIAKLKIGKKQIIAIFVALFIAVLFGEQLMTLVFQIISSGHFALYNKKLDESTII